MSASCSGFKSNNFGEMDQSTDQMREKRVAVQRSEDLRRVRKAEKSGEREDDEAVLERLSDLRARPARGPPHVRCLHTSLLRSGEGA